MSQFCHQPSSTKKPSLTLTFPELLLSVVTRDLNLEHIERDDVGGESTEALPATATNTHQQHVPSRLSDHPHNTAHWRPRCRKGEQRGIYVISAQNRTIPMKGPYCKGQGG